MVLLSALVVTVLCALLQRPGAQIIPGPPSPSPSPSPTPPPGTGGGTSCSIAGRDLTNVEPYSFSLDQSYQGAKQKYNWMVSPCEKSSDLCPTKAYISQKDGTQCSGMLSATTLKEVKVSGDGLLLTYTADKGQALVTVKCNKAVPKNTIVKASTMSAVEVTSSGSTFTYTFVMESACACSGGCGGGLGGWIFVILLLVGFFVYFVGGFAFNYKKRELRGVAAIPHKAFWADLPSLVRDGVRFAASGCGRKGYTAV